jgi:hypothetical protein
MELIAEHEMLNIQQIEERIGIGVNRFKMVPINERGIFAIDLKGGRIYVMKNTGEVRNYKTMYRCVTSYNLINVYEFLLAKFDGDGIK